MSAKQTAHLKTNPNRWFWGTGGVVVGLMLLAVMAASKPLPVPDRMQGLQADSPSNRKAIEPIRVASIRAAAWEKVQPHLSEAADQENELRKQCIERVQGFIDARKKGAKKFAEAALGFWSKWALVKSKIPYSDKAGHTRYLREQFSEYIFDSATLEKVLHQAIAEYLAGVEAIENQLLVNVRADLKDFPPCALPFTLDKKGMELAFAQAISRAQTTVGESLQVDVARELGAFAAGELATALTIRILSSVGTRLGISAGILGAGGASAAKTFGIGLVAAVIIDYVVGCIVDWYYDPEGEIAAKVSKTLDDLSQELIKGKGGLEEELKNIAGKRQALRGAALEQLIKGQK